MERTMTIAEWATWEAKCKAEQAKEAAKHAKWNAGFIKAQAAGEKDGEFVSFEYRGKPYRMLIK